MTDWKMYFEIQKLKALYKGIIFCVLLLYYREFKRMEELYGRSTSIRSNKNGS